MPRETVFLIRCAFAWLLASCGGLVLMALDPQYGVALRPVVLHGLTIGWLCQFIFGVAHWLFPKHPRVPPRGHVRRVWWVGALWNAAMVLRAMAEPLVVLGRGSAPVRGLLVLSGVLLVAASVGMVGHLWPRTRSVMA